MGNFKDITGKVFGRLTVIEPTNQRKQGAVVWKCKCQCGNDEVYASRANLEQGFSKSCGCLKSEVVSKKMKEIKPKDIKGQKFGRLTALEPTEQRDNEYVVWQCLCECSNITYVNIHNLISGNTKSCGCYNSEVASKNENLVKFKNENYIAGTRLDIVKGVKKINKNNTTGHTGVYLRKKDNRYIAQIEFQGKMYFLGSYENKEDAIKIRKQVENKLYGDFLKWYNENKSKK